MTRHLYAFVDETGQDTGGELFIDAVVIAEQDVDAMRQACQRIERENEKGAWKWHRVSSTRQAAYARRVMNDTTFCDRLFFSVHRGSRDYFSRTMDTIGCALEAFDADDAKVTVVIDGLPPAHEQQVSHALHRRGVHTRKVRGARDASEPLIRLADALCGLVRAARDGDGAHSSEGP